MRFSTAISRMVISKPIFVDAGDSLSRIYNTHYYCVRIIRKNTSRRSLRHITARRLTIYNVLFNIISLGQRLCVIGDNRVS